MPPKPLKTFIIYSHEDLPYKTGLEKFLRHLVRKGKIALWSDKEIKPGEYWDASIKLNLGEAEVILMLVSVDFYNSEYIQDTEFQRAKERFDKGEALVIPILVRYCPWKSYELIRELQALPSGARSIDTWASIDQAFTDIAENLESAVDELLERRAAEERRLAEAEHREQEAQAHRKAEEIAAQTRENLRQQRDETAWKTASKEAGKATDAKDKIAAYEIYLESGYTQHEKEANRRIHALEEEDTKLRITARKNSRNSIRPENEQESAFPKNNTTLHSGPRDDLTIIEGIGPKTEELLFNAGITTYGQLSATGVQQLKNILADAGPRFSMHDPGAWPAQALLAANGEWPELKAYQDFLNAGKRPEK